MTKKSAFTPLKMKSLTGFTLIELMIVMAVIAILIGIILPMVGGFREEANINRARGDLSTLRTAMESYYIHHSNAYPPALTGLTDTTTNPKIVTRIPDDPFLPGTTYQVLYSTNNQFYALWSVGPGGTASVTAVANTGGVTQAQGAGARNPIWVANGDEQTPAESP
ncbi:MAG: prepilin-type N-terminal cleavage/methylation domain-containing protein [Candidatus Omnitrophica bacterium]|nr:prepilin-type N-terminal cleavage/methylation domain-containing protein [Candidatus Omnitrophota bacterium]